MPDSFIKFFPVIGKENRYYRGMVAACLDCLVGNAIISQHDPLKNHGLSWMDDFYQITK
jgi:hypothetical protein